MASLIFEIVFTIHGNSRAVVNAFFSIIYKAVRLTGQNLPYIIRHLLVGVDTTNYANIRSRGAAFTSVSYKGYHNFLNAHLASLSRKRLLHMYNFFL